MEEGGSVAIAASFDDTLQFSVERIDFDRVKERIKNALQAGKNPPPICPKSRKTASIGRSRVLDVAGREAGSIEKQWMRDLTKLKREKPDFFKCGGQARRRHPCHEGESRVQRHSGESVQQR